MNVVGICNIALSHVGGYRIQSLSEPTKEARECNTHYEIARDATLSAHNWDFARKRQTLALLSQTYSGWDYAYQYPTDCLVPRKIHDPSGLEDENKGGVEYEIAANTSGNGKVILTNEENAELVYTAKITDANLFSPQFTESLALRLAASLAQPIKGKPELATTFLNQFQIAVSGARATDAKQGHKKPSDQNTFVEARS